MLSMLNIMPSPETGWPALLARLPADLDLNALARETKAIQRERGITDAADLSRLGFMHGPGGKTLKETSAWAYLSGYPSIFTYSKSPGRLSTPCRGGAIQDA